jgi:hypothetical protein
VSTRVEILLPGSDPGARRAYPGTYSGSPTLPRVVILPTWRHHLCQVENRLANRGPQRSIQFDSVMRAPAVALRSGLETRRVSSIQPSVRAVRGLPPPRRPPISLNRMRLAQVSGTQVRAVPHAARARCSLKPAASESSVGRRAGLAAGGGLLLASPPAMAGTLSDSLTGTFFEGATTGDIAVQVGLVFAFGLLLLLSGGVRTAQTPCFSA